MRELVADFDEFSAMVIAPLQRLKIKKLVKDMVENAVCGASQPELQEVRSSSHKNNCMIAVLIIGTEMSQGMLGHIYKLTRSERSSE